MSTPSFASNGHGVGERAVFGLVLVGTAVTAACYYPGYLNGDSSWQYAQGVSGEYNDMHPVVMSWLLGRLDGIIEGSGGMFLLTTIGFWSGLGLVLRAFTSSSRGFWIAAGLIGTSFPVFSMVAQIQKDLGMVVSLLWAFALLVRAERARSLRALLGALPCLWYALAVRHNGVFAVLPLALVSGWLLARDHLPSQVTRHLAAPWRRLALGALILALLFSTSVLATRAILGERGQRFPFQQILMAYDLVGISVRTGRSVVSDVYYPQHPFTRAELRAMYNDGTAFFLFWGQPALRKVPLTATPEVVRMIQRAWLRAIVAEPRAYLAHRVGLLLAQLGGGTGQLDRQIGLPRDREFNYRGPTVFAWPHARALVRLFDATRTTILFHAWPYLLLGMLAAVWAWLRPNRHRTWVTLLVTSAAAYIAPLLFIGVASDFRYMWWPIVAAMLQVVLAVDGRAAGGLDTGGGDTRPEEDARSVAMLWRRARVRAEPSDVLDRWIAGSLDQRVLRVLRRPPSSDSPRPRALRALRRGR